MLEKVFHLKANRTDAKTEIMAGITTFMTMAYILAVNPNILSAAGMDANAVLIATSLAAFVGTALMALMANYPFALAPGMGPERLLCLHRGSDHGLQLAGRLDGRLCGGPGVHRAVPDQHPRGHLQRHPHDPEIRCQRGHRPVCGLCWPAERQAHRGQQLYPGELPAL